MDLTFNDRLIFNDSTREKFKAWYTAEKFLNFGQKSYKIDVIKDKIIYIESSTRQSSLFKVLLRVLICFTIALPFTIAAAITKQIYRKKYEFKLIPPKVPLIKNEENKGQPETKGSQKIGSQKEDLIIKQEPLRQNNPQLLQTPNSENPTTPSVQQFAITAYDVNQVIARIHAAKAEGLKVGIFMGRDNSQVLPHEKGWEWFSLDETLHEGKKDLHLQMNFNENLYKIEGLFNKVISDNGTIDYYKDPWPTLHSLLEKKEDSELITESSGRLTGKTEDYDQETAEFYPQNLNLNVPVRNLIRHLKDEKAAFQKWQNQVGEAVVKQEFEEFFKLNEDSAANSGISRDVNDPRFMQYILKKEGIEPPPPPTYKYALHKSIEELLEKFFFNKIELCFGKFPYRTDKEAIETTYWKLRYPKELPKNWKAQAKK